MNWSANSRDIGERMEDGTVYVGISPNSGQPLYVMPEDNPTVTSYDLAERQARRCNAHGHDDWRMPTRLELNVLFNNRAAIGGFSQLERNASVSYWSSSPVPNEFEEEYVTKRFGDGNESDSSALFDEAALRLVRG